MNEIGWKTEIAKGRKPRKIPGIKEEYKSRNLLNLLLFDEIANKKKLYTCTEYFVCEQIKLNTFKGCFKIS